MHPVYDSIACIVLLASLLLITGCTGPGSDGPPSATPTISMTGTPPPATSPGRPRIDLTNRNSSRAAIITGTSSVTRFAPVRVELGLRYIAGGFSAPVQLVASNDGSGRNYIVEQGGLVRIIAPGGTVLPAPFIDVRDRMVRLNAGYDERGLLSMAFHPRYHDNGKVYLYYNRPLQSGGPAGYDSTLVLTELQATPADPDRVDMASERVLVEIHKPASNHNGGTLRFGPDDGYLYLFVGDGGGANDVGFGHTPGTGNAQDLATLLGKVLRIDVDTASGGRLYGIPSTNPFVGEPSIRPEIYAYGLRNPAYAAFDSGGDHHLYAWNAGQALFESAYRIVRGGNFGWNIREGTHCFNPASPARPPTTCPITGSRGEPLTGPIVELGHDAGNTIVGGMIYRGNELTGLQGSMIYGTWSGRGGSGAVLLSSPPPRDARSSNEMWETAELRIAKNPGGRVNAYVRGVYEGADGEAYLLINHNAGPVEQPPTGEIWKFVPADSPGLEPV